jgi:hypothetical protein
MLKEGSKAWIIDEKGAGDLRHKVGRTELKREKIKGGRAKE